MKKSIIIFFFLSLLGTNVRAQDTTFISLEYVLTQVETNYPSILQYQQNMEAWQAKAEGAKAWMPPTFSTGLMRFPYMLGMVNDKNTPMNQSGLAFSVEQMIPNSSKLNAKRDYVNSLAEIEKSKRDWTKNELYRDAKTLYYNRYVNERKLKIVRESDEVLNLLITTAEARFSSNQSQLQTIFKAKARLAEIKNMDYMLRSMIAESNIGLNMLLLRDLNTSFSIDSIIEPKQHSPLADTAAINNRSNIVAMEKAINSMELEQKVMKLGTRPDFGVRGEHMQMFGMPNQWSVMGMITLPIVPWSAKMYSSDVKSMASKIRGMELEKQNMELMAKRMSAEKQAMLRYSTQQYENYRKEIIPAYENNMQANMLAYRQNTGNFFVLLDAWEMLLMKKMEMLDKLADILKLQTDFEYEKEIR